MRSRLRQLRLLFCALRYGFRLIWLAAPEHHKLHWFVTLASSLHGDRRLASRLHSSLPRLAPLAAAFAQTLATRPELAGATLHDAIDAVEHFEDPLSGEALTTTLRTALGKPPETLFMWIDPKPAHNGWCEQTHVARLALPVNGHQTITLRVLRAQQVQEVDDDAALLCAVARWMERFSRAARKLQLRALAQALREDLQRRFDLRAQAANLSQSGHHLGEDPRIVVPDVIWDLCTPQTLAVQHIDTVPATDPIGLAEHHINVTQVAAHLVEVVTRQAFEHGFFHAAFDARRVAVSVEPETRGRLVLAGASLMTSLSSPEREFFVHGATALFEQDYGRLATLHHVAGHVPAHARTEQIEAELRTRSEAHFASDSDERSAGALFHHLLHAVQPFGGEVSPRLVAAQRSFGQAEALARSIHPGVDAWGIARDTLADIARRDLGHHGWIRRLSQELPHLAQIAPRVPQMLFRFFEHHAALSQGHPGGHAAQATMLEAWRREHRRTRALLLACAVCGGVIGVTAVLFAG
ncbi:ABC1 kinase family protein [Paraburkholderia unamae]|uniref:Ubiquinone biosynthesis protein n=1 Tax=Paraburkholderia unamae TaxID=219649 RepID=A0ABX5K945_9BURK|nr:AarF/UbiB family protein [Paraburkholderia unamae]PVX71210.1 ubiquinone biosynthesis protein [Paraburkholderia unamae]